MSGRLVGEVIDWLQTSAAGDLTLAERTILIVVAERSNEKTRDAWRHRTDEQSLYERIRSAANLTDKGLSSALRRLRDRGLEVRVPIKEGKDGRPIFAHEGMAMRFRLPELPASVSLPESPSGDRPSEPVDNHPEGPPQPPECPSTQRGTGLRAPLGREQSPSQERALIPLYPSTTNPSRARGCSEQVAEVEARPREAGEPSKTHFDFRSACAFLLTLPGDIQRAAETQALDALGADAGREAQLIRAAEIAAKGIPA